MIALALLFLSAGETSATTEHFSHSEWTQVLSRHVTDQGLVDYQALAKNPAALRRYITAIASVGPTARPDLFPTENDRLAYYLNAYNALVFEGVLARGPEPDSVWNGGLISGYRFFVAMKFEVDGKKTSLKKLEDDLVRDQFRDPRVHAALNCASVGCPRLPQKAFDPAHLEEELDAAMREFVSSTKHVRVDTEESVVYLSRIFDWFSSDFLAHEKEQGTIRPTLIDYVNRYRDDSAHIPIGFKVRFLEYDKGINAV